MSNDDLVQYRISRAYETLEEVLLLAKENHWNAVANRLYYSCFYIINALLIKNRKSFSSHNGVKSEFHKSFVKTDLVSKKSGKLYNRIFNLRQEGDYIDFKRFEKDDIEPYIVEVKEFLNEIDILISK